MINSFELNNSLDVLDSSKERWRTAKENGVDAISIRKGTLIYLRTLAEKNIAENDKLAKALVDLVTYSMSFNCNEVATIPVSTLGQLVLFAEGLKDQELD